MSILTAAFTGQFLLWVKVSPCRGPPGAPTDKCAVDVQRPCAHAPSFAYDAELTLVAALAGSISRMTPTSRHEQLVADQDDTPLASTHSLLRIPVTAYTNAAPCSRHFGLSPGETIDLLCACVAIRPDPASSSYDWRIGRRRWACRGDVRDSVSTALEVSRHLASRRAPRAGGETLSYTLAGSVLAVWT